MSFSIFILTIFFTKPIIEVDNKVYEPVIESVIEKLKVDPSHPSNVSFLIKYLMQFPFVHYVEAYKTEEGFLVSLKTKFILKKIKLYGFKKWEDEWLRKRISLRINEYYTEEELNNVKGEIENLLKMDGYNYVDLDVSKKSERESAVLYVRLKAGKRMVIKEVMVDNEYKIFKGMKGTDFSRLLIEEKVRSFKESLTKNGFLEADAEWEGIEDGTVLKIKVLKGKRFRFRVISGLNLLTDYDFKRIAMRVYEENGFLDKDKITRIVKEILAKRGLDKSIVAIRNEETDAEKIYTLLIFENKGLFVKKISFEGRRGIPEKKLKEVMKTTEKRWFKRIFSDENGVLINEWLKEDINSLKKVYREASFLDAEVQLGKIIEKQDGYEIVIRINEGKKYIVDKIDFLTSLPQAFKVKKPSLPAGVYEVESYLLELKEAFKNSGFLEADISADRYILYETEKEVHLRYIIGIKEGTKHKVGDVFFMGSKRIRNHLLDTLLSDIKNSPFAPDTRLKIYTRLSALDYFSDINIKTFEQSKNNAIDLGVSLTERAPRRFTLGFGYATEEGARVFGGAGFYDLFGEGIDLVFYGKVASWIHHFKPEVLFDEKNYELSVFEGRMELHKKVFFHRNLVGGLITDYRYINRPAFEVRYLDLSFVNRAEISPSAYFTGGYTFRRREPIEYSLEYAEEARFTIVGFLTSSFLLDRRDNKVLPEKGFILEIRADLALQELASEGDYVKFLVRGKEYIPLNGFLNLRITNRIGYAKSFLTEFKVPIEERFFLGGSNSIRGFEEDSVSPKDASNKYIGGNFMINYGVELSIKAGQKLSFALFFDGGGVFEDAEAFDTAGLREGAGFGVRWSTPIGEIAGDMGFKLDRRADEKINVFHFSVGRFL